jgi:hypothetical protein
MFKQSQRNAKRFWKNSGGFLSVFAAVALTGCATIKQPESAANACEIFPAPKYAVLGKTPYDQDEIDAYVAIGSEVCGKPRPLPRPPELDAPARPQAAPVATKRPGILRRTINRAKGVVSRLPVPRPGIITPALAAPVAPVVPEEPKPAAPVDVQPPPVPRDPLDELLNPT